MRSMSRFLLFAPSVLLLASCTMITVDPDDTSAPEFTVLMPAASALAATYIDGGREALGDTIDVSREFQVTVPHDRRIFQLLIIAADQQSGIYQVRGRMNVSFKCQASVLGGPVERMAAAYALKLSPPDLPTLAAPGSRTPDSRAVIVELTLEDLWRQGNCSTWGQIINHNYGRLTDIKVRYSMEAWNNNYPDTTSYNTISGSFAVADADVSLD